MKKTLIRKVTSTSISLDDLDIVTMLKNKGEIPKVIANVSIFIKIPGGGDYSNMDLEINKDCPVRIEYDEIERNE